MMMKEGDFRLMLCKQAMRMYEATVQCEPVEHGDAPTSCHRHLPCHLPADSVPNVPQPHYYTITSQ